MSDEGRSFTIPGNDTSGFVGVDPEYMNYASETDKPRLTKKDMRALVASGEFEFVDVQVPADKAEEINGFVVDPVIEPDPENVETTVETGTSTSASDADVEVTF